MSDSELSASTALLGRLEDAVGSYWDCAYQEGHLNRPDGDKANAILHEIRCAVQALVAAERETCARFCGRLASMMEQGAGELAPGGRLRQAEQTIRRGDHYPFDERSNAI